MKNITNLMALVAILIEQFLKNPELVYRRFEFFVNEKWNELAEEIKLKFYRNTKLIDGDWNNVTPYSGPEKTNKELLEVLVKKVRSGGHTMGYNNGSTGYDDDIKAWGFMDEKVPEKTLAMDVPILPDGTMTEGDMFKQAKLAKMEHEHFLGDSLRIAIALWDTGYYVKGLANGCWTPFYLKKRRKSDNVPCRLDVGFDSDGEFCVGVDEVDEADRWRSPRVGLPLSNLVS